jgi:hypothetical protein
MTRAQVIAELRQLGIRIENGKACRADVERVLGAGKGESDIDSSHKAEFLAAAQEAKKQLSNLGEAIEKAAGIAQDHDPSGLEKEGLKKIDELLDEVASELHTVIEACKSNRKS